MASRILQEIPTGSALELVSSVLSTTSPPGPTFHSTLDALLSPFPLSSLSRGDLVELHSPAAIGKTQLLYFICMTTVLPFELVLTISGTDVHILLGGRGKSVVVCDCDGRWDILRLGRMVQNYISRRIAIFSTLPSAVPETVMSDAVTSALRHVHIFRPTSTISLAATLLALPSYHRTKMKDEEMRMLMIDSITAFYWSDRWDMERSQPRSHDSLMKHVSAILSTIRRDLGAVVFMTTQMFFPGSASSTLLRSNLPTPTHHISLSQPPIEPFPAYTSLEEARADQRRKQAVQDAIVEGIVKDKGSFDFSIKDWGLVIEQNSRPENEILQVRSNSAPVTEYVQKQRLL